MQIRKRGASFQLLRKLTIGETVSHTTLGSFPVTCKYSDIPKTVLSCLTKKEKYQLDIYLDRYWQKQAQTLLVRRPRPKDFKGQEVGLEEDQDILDLRLTIAGLCSQGYGPEIVSMIMEMAAKSIPVYTLDEIQARSIWKAWTNLRSSVSNHGFTLGWFNKHSKKGV